MTEKPQNADFRRKPQIFADWRLLLEIPAFGGRRKPQKTADFRRKPQIFAENRRKPQIGLCHLRSVTFSSALVLLSCILRLGLCSMLWKNFSSRLKLMQRSLRPYDRSRLCNLALARTIGHAVVNVPRKVDPHMLPYMLCSLTSEISRSGH